MYSPRRRPVPPLVDVAHELRPPDHDEAVVALVPHQRLELAGTVHKDQVGLIHLGGHTAFKDWGKGYFGGNIY